MENEIWGELLFLLQFIKQSVVDIGFNSVLTEEIQISDNIPMIVVKIECEGTDVKVHWSWMILVKV